jgi:acetyl esterase/lipase
MVEQPAQPALLTVDDYMALPEAPADHRLAYGPGPEQFGDLYLPAGTGPHPVAIALHGGCWRARYGLEPLGPLCRALAEAGLAVWSVEYRRLGGGGGWPGTFADVGAAADFLRGAAGQYNLDLSRVISIGHSAGGHLALWLAARHRIDPASPLFSAEPLALRGVVALAGIPDLAEGARRAICGNACQELVGGPPAALAERYRAASPNELLPLGVPQHHIVGADDDTVPPDYLRAYVAAAARHDPARLEVLPATGHFELVAPASPAWPIVRAAVLGMVGGTPAA